MADTPLRVIIIGAGIGGLALGQALAGAGVDVQIHERNHNAADWLQGYRLNINPHGARALHQCLPAPLWEAFVATSVASPAGITFRTERLTELLTLRRDDMIGGSADPARGQYGVSRLVLRNLLLAGLPDVVRFGATFERYTVGDNGRITAHFTDGSTATGDVLIGADGANSRVRGQYLPRAGRVETAAASIAGRLPLTPQTRSWLPEHLANGMTLVMPPRCATPPSCRAGSSPCATASISLRRSAATRHGCATTATAPCAPRPGTLSGRSRPTWSPAGWAGRGSGCAVPYRPSSGAASVTSGTTARSDPIWCARRFRQRVSPDLRINSDRGQMDSAVMGSSTQSDSQPSPVVGVWAGAGRCSTTRVGATASSSPRIDPTPSTIKE
ncbi:MAG: FAD-dependent monooxygenase [Pseudonocardiaceae bacterium]